MCRDGALTRPSSAKSTLTLTLTPMHSMSSGYRPMFSTLADHTDKLPDSNPRQPEINCASRKSHRQDGHGTDSLRRAAQPVPLAEHHLLGTQLVLAPLQLGRRMQLGVVPYQALDKLHVGASMHPRRCSPFLLAPLHLGRPLHLGPRLCSRRCALARVGERCVRGREGGIS